MSYSSGPVIPQNTSKDSSMKNKIEPFKVVVLGGGVLLDSDMIFVKGLMSLGFELEIFGVKTSAIMRSLEAEKASKTMIHEAQMPDWSQYNKHQVVLFLNKPSMKVLKSVIGAGLVPIMSLQTAPKNFTEFDPQLETGNAFLYDENNRWHLFATLIRARENHKFVYDWHQLKKALLKLEL